MPSVGTFAFMHLCQRKKCIIFLRSSYLFLFFLPPYFSTISASPPSLPLADFRGASSAANSNHKLFFLVSPSQQSHWAKLAFPAAGTNGWIIIPHAPSSHNLRAELVLATDCLMVSPEKMSEPISDKVSLFLDWWLTDWDHSPHRDDACSPSEAAQAAHCAFSFNLAFLETNSVAWFKRKIFLSRHFGSWLLFDKQMLL